MEKIPDLQIITVDGQIYHFPIRKNEISIGRSKDNDIALLDHTVSRNHARIMKTREGFLLTDLGSFNGTQVNKKSIQSILLNHRDRIKIGFTNLVFLEEKEEEDHSESLVLSTETDFERGKQHIVQSSPEDPIHRGSKALLTAVAPQQKPGEDTSAPSIKRKAPAAPFKEEISSLERSNKVLFVLYEISRQLNTIHDFNELLNKIVDLIFMVIDADYGYLILTGEKGEEDLIPVVVKSNRHPLQGKTELKASRTIINRVIHDKIALLTSNAMADSRFDHAKSVIIQQIRSAICVPLWKKDKIIGVIQLESARFDNQFTQDDLELLKAIGSQIAMVIEQASLNEQIRAEEQMRSRLERFHSPQVIEMIIKGSQETKDNIMDPKDLTATILFTDINGFTRLSEQMPPREINLILNEYFSRMTDIVFKYDGTLDKYIGDGLMAVFGAPMEKPDDAQRAIYAAKEMIKELPLIMSRIKEEKRFTIRIGINTGRVVAGNIGSPKRMDYTIIGDPVNIASRLESIALPNQILIGEETYRLIKDTFPIKVVGPRKVKGKVSEIMVYEVL